MAHNFLILKVADVPDWTKNNVSTYPLARFSNDGSEIIIDNSHHISTYLKWLGATLNAEQVLQELLFKSVCVSAEDFKTMELDPDGNWSNVGSE